jgi:release factor glutamine methyltransferase
MIAALLDSAARQLAQAGFDDPRRQARRLLAMALGLSPTEIFAHPERRLDASQCERIAAVLSRLVAGEPLSRIAGMREFWGLEFVLSPDTLDPRPETETLVEAVLARLPDKDRRYRILDLGTGSGCLLSALLSEYRRAEGFGVDIVPGAVRAARDNAARLGLGGRGHFAVSDWARAVSGAFDVIVANPPYIPQPEIAGLPAEVRDYDPYRALEGGDDGLAAYRTIAAGLPRLLGGDAIFAAEIGSTQAPAVTAILGGVNLHVEAVLSDLAGLPRCIIARQTPRTS